MDKSQKVLPKQSILLKSDKRASQKNFFYSELSDNNISQSDIESENDDKLVKELKDILKCCICLRYLDNPVYDPICPHYACKKCLDNYFAAKKSNIIPCPLCRKKIRKNHLIKLPLLDSIKELIKGAKNKEDINYDIEDNIGKCSKHQNNKILYICMDCRVKMCQNCDKEKEKHESQNHHVTSYEKYLKIYYIFKNNFQGIKQIISSQEKNINDYKNLISFLEQQKIEYLELFNSIHKQIKKVYTQNQESLNKIIAENMHNIAKLKNFMINIKSYISQQFKEKYDEINNLDLIDKEIKERIGKLNLKEFDKVDFTEIKKKYFKTLYSNIKSQTFTLNKAELIKESNICCKVDESGIYSYYTFGIGLSKNKKEFIIYLDINKYINNKINESSYVVCIEFGEEKKRLYLELYPDEKYYSFENSIYIDEIFENNQNLTDIKLIILHLSIN
jgi:hypothetical protein